MAKVSSARINRVFKAWSKLNLMEMGYVLRKLEVSMKEREAEVESGQADKFEALR